jgi:calcineurin-like phosphoesterase
MGTNYPNGFANGITLRGVPIGQTHPGKVFWSRTARRPRAASASAPTTAAARFDQPFATLAYAVSQCLANNGDIIFVLPLHAETISSATALTINIAGIAIVGLGMGTNRPTFTLGTATTATINVTAANVAISNVLFKANLADIVSLFTTTTAKSFTLDTCEFRDNASNLNFARIVDTNATTNDTDDLTINNCRWYTTS